MQLTQNRDLLLLHLSLNRITFLQFEEKKILAKKLDSSHSLVLLSIEEICKIIDRNISKTVNWDGKENLRMATIAAHFCESMKIKIVLHSDDEYPELLRQIQDPPYLLFCRGNETLLKGNCVSVVGTRRLTQNGKNAAFGFARDAALNGFNVVSGLAYGADGYAHKGVLETFYECEEKGILTEVLGKTIAVLPSAIDEIVPNCHKRLASQIIQCGGCLISEYEPGIGMAPWHYIARNRIIAGLSSGTVVIEAPAGSGALITADFALEYNRDLMFHKAIYGDVAKKLAISVQGQLEKDFAAGRVSQYKVENRPEKYLEAGAPVINSFQEYLCASGSYMVLKKKSVPEQGELF